MAFLSTYPEVVDGCGGESHSRNVFGQRFHHAGIARGRRLRPVAAVASAGAVSRGTGSGRSGLSLTLGLSHHLPGYEFSVGANGEMPRSNPHHIVKGELYDEATLRVDLLKCFIIISAFEWVSSD